MKALERYLLSLLNDNTIRFVVPVYQRNYAWGEAQWQRLWQDIINITKNPGDEHFTGSIVWVAGCRGRAKTVTPIFWSMASNALQPFP